MSAEQEATLFSSPLHPLARVWLFLLVVAGAYSVYAQYYAVYRPNPATGQIVPIPDHSGYAYVTPLQSWIMYAEAAMVIATVVAGIIRFLVVRRRETT